MSSKKYIFVFITILVFSIFLFCADSENQQYDLVIKSGKIIDGTGNPWFYGDVGIRGNRIVKIGEIDAVEAGKIIDAKGLFVVPGFIDVHTHVDRLIDSVTTVDNYLLQGVTTTVGGNCGGSVFPLKELFEKLDRKGIAVNFASLVGHNTIRGKVMGRGDKQPTEDEMAEMKKLVRQEMESGAIGISTGLAYVPGRYSETEEIIELTKEVQPFDGIYATHLRNQSQGIKQAIEEAIRIGREAGVPVQISHIKLAHEAVWGNYELITGPIEEAREQGFEVYMDQYPYTATSSGFSSSFRGWAVAGGHDAFVERLKDPDKYEQIKQGLIDRRLTSIRGIDKTKTIYISYNSNHPEYEGKNIAEILDMLGKENTISNAADLIIKMYREDQPRGIFFQMDEEDVAALMQKPYNMHASDGKIEIPGVEVPHPRAYGTFPRVISKYVREMNVIRLEDAIRKMTSLPAQAMGFYDRSVLKTGCFADVVIFDFEKISDMATFQKPHQYPAGIYYVIVNGKVAVERGKIINKNAGMVLKN